MEPTLQHLLSYSDPQKLQEQIPQLTDSVSVYSLAIQILTKCKTKTQPLGFLSEKEFLFVGCNFVRVALLKLQLASQYVELYKTCTGEELSSEKVKELDGLKEAIEKFMNDEKMGSSTEYYP